MSHLVFTFFSLLSLCINAATLQTSFWVCQMPCEDTKTMDTLPTVSFGYCGEQALDFASIEVGTKVCKEHSGNPNARAVRKSANGLLAYCETSGSECHTRGLHSGVFNCKVSCPSDNFHVRDFSVCAPTNFEAWNVKDKVCPGGREPSAIPPLRICVARGETACTK